MIVTAVNVRFIGVGYAVIIRDAYGKRLGVAWGLTHRRALQRFAALRDRLRAKGVAW